MGTGFDARHRYTHLELGPYPRLCQSFRDAILVRDETAAEGEGSVPAARFEDGLANVAVTEAARRSLASGQWADVEATALRASD